jgi:hypothetical protein
LGNYNLLYAFIIDYILFQTKELQQRLQVTYDMQVS